MKLLAVIFHVLPSPFSNFVVTASPPAANYGVTGSAAPPASVMPFMRTVAPLGTVTQIILGGLEDCYTHATSSRN